MRERMREDGGRMKKCFCRRKKNPGHLVRWNYISNAHRALMLLSHQHIAQTGMVYLHVCAELLPLKCCTKPRLQIVSADSPVWSSVTARWNPRLFQLSEEENRG